MGKEKNIENITNLIKSANIQDLQLFQECVKSLQKISTFQNFIDDEIKKLTSTLNLLAVNMANKSKGKSETNRT